MLRFPHHIADFGAVKDALSCPRERGGTMTATETAESSCCVCQLSVVAHMEAYCSACGKLYHLNQRSDLPGEDCGQVWINEEHLGLEFACRTCLEPEAQGGLDDVLDAVEAAGVAGVGPSMLIAAADAGAIRHRKTGSGTYLFERGDVLAYAGR